jgi:hypothetical protein
MTTTICTIATKPSRFHRQLLASNSVMTHPPHLPLNVLSSQHLHHNHLTLRLLVWGSSLQSSTADLPSLPCPPHVISLLSNRHRAQLPPTPLHPSLFSLALPSRIPIHPYLRHSRSLLVPTPTPPPSPKLSQNLNSGRRLPVHHASTNRLSPNIRHRVHTPHIRPTLVTCTPHRRRLPHPRILCITCKSS